MIVKDFLLTLDFNKLCKTFIDMYFSEGSIAYQEVKKAGHDVETKVREKLAHVLNQIKELTPNTKENNKLVVSKYYDFDFDDNMESKITTNIDAYLVNIDKCKRRGTMSKIKTMDEAINEPVIETYSLMLLTWEEIIGYETYSFGCDNYEAGAAILFEMTFFGYDYDEYNNRVKEVQDELDETKKEFDEGNAKSVEYDDEDFCQTFNIQQHTPEQKEKERILHIEIAVKNYNINIDIYNDFWNRGIFSC